MSSLKNVGVKVKIFEISKIGTKIKKADVTKLLKNLMEKHWKSRMGNGKVWLVFRDRFLQPIRLLRQ